MTPQEYTLTLDTSMLTYEQVKAETADFEKHIFISGSAACTIQPSNLCLHFEEVSSDNLIGIAEQMDLSSYTSNEFFRGFKVIYALKNGQIKFYYIPVVAKYSIGTIIKVPDGNISIDAFTFNYEDLSQDSAIEEIIKKTGIKIYELTESGLMPVSDKPSILRFVNDYKNNYSVYRDIASSTVPRESFMPTIDIQAVFFPYQEIKKMIDDSSSASIFFISVSYRHNNSYAHSLCIAAEDINRAVPPAINFRGKAANLSQLCPPHCKSIFVNNGRLVDLQ